MKIKRYAHGDMTDTTLPLYEQQVAETYKAYEAYKHYQDMGDERSLEAVSRYLSKSKQLMQGWSSRWHWQNRITAWNRFKQQTTEAAVRQQQQRNASVWAERESEIRENEWKMSQLLLAKAEQMFAMPITRVEKTVEQRDENGVLIAINTTIVNPVRFDFGTAASLLEKVSKLRRLATGMETDRVTTNVEGALATTAASPAQVVIMLPPNGRPMQAVKAITAQSSPVVAPPAGPAGQNGASTLTSGTGSASAGTGNAQ